MVNLITEHLDVWTTAQVKKSNGGRGRGDNSNGQSNHGIKKLRELILELAVRGKLVPQDPNDEQASVLLKKIAKEKSRKIKEGKIKNQKELPKISENEKPFKLPSGWEWFRVGEVFDFQYGKSLPAKNRDETGDVDVYGSNGIVGKHTEPLVVDPCIIIGRKGSAGALNKAFRKSWTTDVAYFFIPPIGFDFDFTFLLLQALRLDELGKGIKPGINRNEAYILVSALPPLAEQHRIVAKVDELMALCDQLELQQTDSNETHQTLVETLLATLTDNAGQRELAKAWQRIANHFDTLFTTEQSIDQLKQTILQLAVMGKLVPQDPNYEPVSILLKKAVNEKKLLGEKWNYRESKKKLLGKKLDIQIPDHWSMVKIGDFAWVKGGKRMPKGSSFSPDITAHIYIRVTDMKELSVSMEDLHYIDEELHELLARYVISKDDLFVVIVGATIGKVGKVPVELDGAHLTENAAKLMFGHIDRDYLLIALQSNLIQSQFVEKTYQQAQPKLALERIRTTIVPMPPLAEQHRIVAKVDELMALCDTLEVRLNAAHTIQLQLADAIVERAVA